MSPEQWPNFASHTLTIFRVTSILLPVMTYTLRRMQELSPYYCLAKRILNLKKSFELSQIELVAETLLPRRKVTWFGNRPSLASWLHNRFFWYPQSKQ